MELFEEATELHKAGKYKEAEEKYDLLFTQNPNNSGLIATYATLCLQLNKVGLAISLFHRAIEKLPNNSEILSNLGLAYKKAGNKEKAFHYLEKACKFNPSAEALSNYGGLYTQTANPEKAIDLCSRALAKNPELIIAHWNLALALLESGQWDKGWDEHEWGLKVAPNASKMRVNRELGGKPEWDGTQDKTVAVYGEQGLGDEIMFSSMIPDLMKTNKVILESHPRLEKLFWQSFGCKVFGTREQEDPQWVKTNDFDYRISIGSLGKFFRRSKESFPGTPYLKAEKAPETGKFRIGISWTGGFKA
jgi:tetratricopeptide (TPR) repeat protein